MLNRAWWFLWSSIEDYACYIENSQHCQKAGTFRSFEERSGSDAFILFLPSLQECLQWPPSRPQTLQSTSLRSTVQLIVVCGALLLQSFGAEQIVHTKWPTVFFFMPDQRSHPYPLASPSHVCSRATHSFLRRSSAQDLVIWRMKTGNQGGLRVVCSPEPPEGISKDDERCSG